MKYAGKKPLVLSNVLVPIGTRVSWTWVTRASIGLDDVFTRVQSENILLDHDFYRSKSILNKIFAEHQTDLSQKVYLQRKYKTIKKNHPNSFTELYMSNLLHLVEHLKDMDEPQFLPDLQKMDATCSLNDLGKNCSLGCFKFS